MNQPVVIVGAGAAGLFAAASLAELGAQAILIERGTQPGRKILVSGGGRCNFTHQASPEAFLAALPRPAARFLKAAIGDLPPEALRRWFAGRGLPSVVEADGCVFPASHRSRDVLAALLQAAQRGAVEMRTAAACRAILTTGDRATGVDTSAGRLAASAVILAAGGPAWPQAGGSAAGIELLNAAGHAVTPLRPGLAPLVVGDEWPRRCQGVSLPAARLTCGKARTAGPLVFTGSGLSGPAALDMSLGLDRLPADVRLSVVPDCSADDLEAELVAAAAEAGGRQVRSLLRPHMPRRLADEVLRAAGIPPDLEAGQLRKDARRRLAERLTAAKLRVTGVGSWPAGAGDPDEAAWAEAMVTVGGCPLGEVNPRTMESRRAGGLYVVGELLDVAGPTGGYNLHAAFATGRLAACSAVRASP